MCSVERRSVAPRVHGDRGAVRDYGIHKAIWDEFDEEAPADPPSKPLTLASYAAGDAIRANVEPVEVGDELQSMPIFLNFGHYILAPLEASYMVAWRRSPKDIHLLVERNGA